MKVFIVHAHPESNSFSSALKNTAVSHFEDTGAEVYVSDLYAMNFNPVGGKHDFLSIENHDYFKYQLEQLHAVKTTSFSPELQDEMDKLMWCDVLIFNFPLWWFGLPAILKGWVDRVFAMGFAYGGGKGVRENGVFKDKKAFACFTTGGPEVAYVSGKNGELEDILHPIQYGMFYFTGMQALTPFTSFSPARATDEERKAELDRYKQFLGELNNRKPLY